MSTYQLVTEPFKVPEGVKITSKIYIEFLKTHFVPWYKTKPFQFKKKVVFVHDGASTHSAKKTVTFLEKIGFKEARLIKWPANSLDLNPIEYFWAITKRRVYTNWLQFDSKNTLWEVIHDVFHPITPEVIRNLVKSVDNRIIEVFKRKKYSKMNKNSSKVLCDKIYIKNYS